MSIPMTNTTYNNSIKPSANSSTNQGPSISEVLSRPGVISLILFELVLIILSTVGNVLVCRTIYLTKRLRCPPYYFVASMCVADLLVGLLVIPVSLAYFITYQIKGQWIFGKSACDAWTLVSLWFGAASVFNLCAVTWDRYVAVATPLRYRSRMRCLRVSVLIGGSWVASFVMSIVTSYGLKISKSRRLCEIQGIPVGYVVANFILIYLLPSMVLIFANVKIWIIAARKLRRVEEFEMTAAHFPVKRRRVHQEIRIFRTFLIIIGSFLVSFSPMFFSLLLQYFVTISGFLAYVFVVITYVNSATDPFIYGIFNNDFRHAMLASVTGQNAHAFPDLANDADLSVRAVSGRSQVISDMVK